VRLLAASGPDAQGHKPLAVTEARRGGWRRASGRNRTAWLCWQHSFELVARADPELGEHLAEVVLDGAPADEQPGRDVGVGDPVPSQSGDLGLLRRELLPAFNGAFADSSPVACSSRSARVANPSTPIAVNISWAVRSCSRASTRRRSRRSHSPLGSPILDPDRPDRNPHAPQSIAGSSQIRVIPHPVASAYVLSRTRRTRSLRMPKE
jgi:hypothetical protein